MAPPALSASAPFVLLDDARETGARPARLYRDPVDVVVAQRPDEVEGALARIEALSAQGLHLAGHMAYEAGLALEPKLAPLAAARCGADGPLLWFGAFAGYTAIAADEVPGWLASVVAGGAAWLGPLEPQISPGGYARAFDAIRAAIEAGDIYQANLTLPLAGAYAGDPMAIHARLRGAAAAGHGGVVYDGAHWLLSYSPELFFSLRRGEVMVRPMKGTRPRGRDAAADAARREELAASPKDRAENLMIVDLMRNDLARVSVPGSVRVEAAFAVETYPTVHQMVTTVRSRLKPGKGAVDLLRALFPCGSVTGAPKIRAMELIAAHEPHPRGAYCGAIGRIEPQAGAELQRTDNDDNETGGAAFNVAIRTLRLTPDGQGGANSGGRAVMGVGSAVVADSDCLAEWRECMVKGGFVRQSFAPPGSGSAPKGGSADGDDAGDDPAPVASFDLIETMAFSPEHGIPLLDLHLTRIGASAADLGFMFDRHAVRNAIQALCFEAEAPSRLRLMIARSGAYALEIGAMPVAIGRQGTGPVGCILLPLPVDEEDWRLRHKTSDRGFYEAGLRAAHAAGAGEALFVRDDGLVTEGCFTNLFVERDGVLLTPPARLGLLPGVLRRSLIEAGRAHEAELAVADLADGFLIGNAVRGLMAAVLV